MNVQYSHIVNKVLADHRDRIWTNSKLMMLRSESENSKRVVERFFAWHCAFGLYALKRHLLNHLIK